MKNLDLISEELFNKIRGRFPTVTIGNTEGVVTNDPKEARFFDFDYKDALDLYFSIKRFQFKEVIIFQITV